MTAFQDGSFAGETLFGTFYPKGYVVAMVEQRALAERAVAALQERGVGETRVWSGDEVLARHDAFMQQRSTLQRIGGAFGADEKVALEDYLDAARSGYVFLTVHAPDHGQVEQIRAVLSDHDARLMHYYADAGMADLGQTGVQPPATFPATDGANNTPSKPPVEPGTDRDPTW